MLESIIINVEKEGFSKVNKSCVVLFPYAWNMQLSFNLELSNRHEYFQLNRPKCIVSKLLFNSSE